MKMSYTIIIIAIVGVCLCLAIGFSEDDVAGEIEELVLENLRATEAEDMDAVLDTMHSQSPHYAQTKKTVTLVFETYDLDYELVLFRYIGQDDEYAIARFQFSAELVAGPEFNDNKLDTIHVFRKENGSWKIWSMAILEIEYI